MHLRFIFATSVLLAAAALPLHAQRGGSRCQVSHRPAELTQRQRADSALASQRRSLEDVLRTQIDSAARQAGVAQAAGLVVIELRGRERGQAAVHLYDANVSEAVVRDAVSRHAAQLASLPARENTLHVRLDLLSLPADTDLSQAEECEPRIVNTDRFHREMSEIQQRESSQGGAFVTPVQVDLRILVARDGRVAYATLGRPSGRGSVDRAVLEAAEVLRFEPATINGNPMDVWVQIPVQLRFSGQR